MPDRPITAVHVLETAEELLREPSPWSSTTLVRRNNVDPSSEWVFRGQSNKPGEPIWKLSPSACRDQAFLPLSVAATKLSHDARQQRDWEIDAVLRFAETVDKHGFVVPDDHFSLRDRRRQPQ